MSRLFVPLAIIISVIPLLAASNPVPLVNVSLLPASVPPGGAGLTLRVEGSGFVPGAVVNWNGTPLGTKYVTHDRLKAAVPAMLISRPGTAMVTVTNPAPGGGTSNVVFFTVTQPTPSLTFSNSTIPVGVSPSGIVAADFDNDGKIDLAVENSDEPNSCYQFDGEGTIQLLTGDGAGGFSTRSQTCFPDTLGTRGLTNLAVGDFNGDGNQDLLAVSYDQGLQRMSSYLGNGNGTFSLTSNVFEQDVIDRLVPGDFNGDGKLDVANPGLTLDFPGVFISLGNGDGSFIFTIAFGPLGTAENVSAAAGDFNRDGILDLAVSNAGIPDQIAILLGNGDGTFTPANVQPVTTVVSPISVVTGDFNGDGNLDLAFADSGSTALTILMGNGDGTFTQKMEQPNAGQTTSYITSADLNGDGKLDLVQVDSANEVLIYLGNGDGTFRTPTAVPVGNGAAQVAIGDFNGDGRLDLAVTNTSDNTVSLLMQAPSATLSSERLDFGEQTVGTQSHAQRIWVSNLGSANLRMSRIAAAGDFSETSGCQAFLRTDRSCHIDVTFTPTEAGVRTGTLTISDDASGSPQIIQLKGIGVGP